MELIISEKALENIGRETRKHPRLETGGILAGLRVGGVFHRVGCVLVGC